MASVQARHRFIETVRLFVVVAFCAAGYQLGRSEPGWLPDAVSVGGSSVLVATILGVAAGYVVGGIVGRLLHHALGEVEQRVERASIADVMIGSVGGVIGALAGILVAVPAALLTPALVWVPVMLFAGWLLGTLGYRVARSKRNELLALGGLSPRFADMAPAGSGSGVLVDTSALIDARLLAVTRTGFVAGPLLVTGFVLDELQGIADASDSSKRRRGRRGLETLDVLRDECGVFVLDDEVPEVTEVDAKLVRIALRREVALLTTDHNLQKVAEVQGVQVNNINRLADALRPQVLAGDRVKVKIESEGRNDAQGVGYMDDGTMVVVGDASGLIGEVIDAVVTSSHQTSVGRMLFARRHEEARTS